MTVSNSTTVTLPPLEASPATVRSFLTALLDKRQKLSDEEAATTADAIASRWHYGDSSNPQQRDVEAGAPRDGTGTPMRRKKNKDLFGLPPGLFFVYATFILMVWSAVATFRSLREDPTGSSSAFPLYSSMDFTVAFLISYFVYYAPN